MTTAASTSAAGYGNEIAYTLNGININNPYGNSRSVGVATNAVQEVSVSSGTFSAEYGGALSGVVNYVTKEGGPRWTGNVRYLTGGQLSGPGRPLLQYQQRRHVPSLAGQQDRGVLRRPAAGRGPDAVRLGRVQLERRVAVRGAPVPPHRFVPLARRLPCGRSPRGASTNPYYFGPAVHDTSDARRPPGRRRSHRSPELVHGVQRPGEPQLPAEPQHETEIRIHQ